jgi:lipid-A-disaccharide synthase
MDNIFIIAAENSAENYGAQVIDEFKKNNAPVRFVGVGGDKFLNQGVEVLFHNREFAVLGLIEVLSSIFKLKKKLNYLFKKAVEQKVKAAILIDYPDFNLRLAKKFKKANIPVYYYISPTVWAWRYSRVKLIRKYTDHIFIIFPFEKEIYKKEKIPFTYTGHPLLYMMDIKENKEQFRNKYKINKSEYVITLLPGSRKSEINFLLEELIKAIELLNKRINMNVFLLKANNIEKEFILEFLKNTRIKITIVEQDQGPDLINSSDMIITTCGTSNLEIAIIGTPFIAVYRVNKLSYLLGIHFIKIRLYSIVNILAKERIIPELIQKNFKADKIAQEVLNIINNEELQKKMISKFSQITKNLKKEKNPAKIIYEKISKELF